MSTRRNDAYALLAVLLLLIGAFLFLSDAVATAWSAGFLSDREDHVRRFYRDACGLGLIFALAAGWFLRIGLKRRKGN